MDEAWNECAQRLPLQRQFAPGCQSPYRKHELQRAFYVRRVGGVKFFVSKV